MKKYITILCVLLIAINVNSQNKTNKNTQQGRIVKVTAATYQKETAKGLVIVDYWAPWCGPCRQLEPILKRISTEKNIKIGKLNVDENKAFTTSKKISTIPTMLIYKDGKEVEHLTGLYSKQELLDIVNKYL